MAWPSALSFASASCAFGAFEVLPDGSEDRLFASYV